MLLRLLRLPFAFLPRDAFSAVPERMRCSRMDFATFSAVTPSVPTTIAKGYRSFPKRIP